MLYLIRKCRFRKRKTDPEDQSVAKWAGYLTRSENAFGDTVVGNAGVLLADLE